MRNLLFVILVALTPVPLVADVRLISHRLPNGLTVVLVPNVASEALAVHLTFDAGSRLDPPGRAGTAWLATRVIGSRLDGFDASLNQERSVFTASVSSRDISDVFVRIRGVLGGDPVSPAELTRARSEVLRDAGNDGHSERAEELVLRLVYDDRPHGHRPETAPARARNKDVDRFLREHYGSASAVVAVAGSFDEQSVMDTIRQALAPLSGTRGRRRCRLYSVRLQRERSRVIHAPAGQLPQIDIGYPTAVAHTADWYALNILADILGQGPDSRLQRKLVAGGLATEYLEGETESPCTSSLLRMRARLASGVESSDVLRAIDEELDHLARHLVPDVDLERAREQERQWSARQMATASGVASAAARAALFYGDAGRATAELAQMLAVTAEDVRRVAQKYLQSSNRGVVLLTP